MVYTTSDEGFEVSKKIYNNLVEKFKMKPVFEDMYRNYYSHDGDMYWVKWDGTKECAEPVVTEHS